MEILQDHIQEWMRHRPNRTRLAWSDRGIAMSKAKIFWMVFTIVSLVSGFALPLMWSVVATIPIVWFSWWVAYRSDWFE